MILTARHRPQVIENIPQDKVVRLCSVWPKVKSLELFRGANEIVN